MKSVNSEVGRSLEKMRGLELVITLCGRPGIDMTHFGFLGTCDLQADLSTRTLEALPGSEALECQVNLK